MTNDDSGLDDLFRRYRASCPEIEPSADFLGGMWQKIEARHSFWFLFQRLGRTAMTASAAICLLLVILNFVSATESRFVPPTYVDALMAEHTAEKTYYTEAIRSTPPGDETRQILHR